MSPKWRRTLRSPVERSGFCALFEKQRNLTLPRGKFGEISHPECRTARPAFDPNSLQDQLALQKANLRTISGLKIAPIFGQSYDKQP